MFKVPYQTLSAHHFGRHWDRYLGIYKEPRAFSHIFVADRIWEHDIEASKCKAAQEGPRASARGPIIPKSSGNFRQPPFVDHVQQILAWMVCTLKNGFVVYMFFHVKPTYNASLVWSYGIHDETHTGVLRGKTLNFHINTSSRMNTDHRILDLSRPLDFKLQNQQGWQGKDIRTALNLESRYPSSPFATGMASSRLIKGKYLWCDGLAEVDIELCVGNPSASSHIMLGFLPGC